MDQFLELLRTNGWLRDLVGAGALFGIVALILWAWSRGKKDSDDDIDPPTAW